MSGRGLKSCLYSSLRLVYGLTLWAQIANLRYPNKDYFRCPSDRARIKVLIFFYEKNFFNINLCFFGNPMCSFYI